MFRWDNPPEGGHPGQAWNCRCVAEPVAAGQDGIVVLADFAPSVGQAGRVVALTPAGRVVLESLAASGALMAFTRMAEDKRLKSAGQILGVDLGTVEGRLAALAYSLMSDIVISGAAEDLPKSPDAAEIAGQAAALFALQHPGTIPDLLRLDPAAKAAVDRFIQDAWAAFEAGRLQLQDGTLAQGWVEVFPELTEDERRLGQLPGFTPERLDQWLEQYPAEELGLPANTGTPVQGDPTDNVISTPVLDEAAPNIVEARPDGTFKTPGGNIVGEHGKKGSGLDYIRLKGHIPEQIDDIIANPRRDLSGFIAGRGLFKGKELKLLTGQDGHWVVLSPEGRVIALSDRNRRLRDGDNDSDPIIRPLE